MGRRDSSTTTSVSECCLLPAAPCTRLCIPPAVPSLQGQGDGPAASVVRPALPAAAAPRLQHQQCLHQPALPQAAALLVLVSFLLFPLPRAPAHPRLCPLGALGSSHPLSLLPAMTSGPSMPPRTVSTSTQCCSSPRTRLGASRSPTSPAMPPLPGCTQASLARSGTPDTTAAALSLCQSSFACAQLPDFPFCTLSPPSWAVCSHGAGVTGEGRQLQSCCCVPQEGL